MRVSHLIQSQQQRLRRCLQQIFQILFIQNRMRAHRRHNALMERQACQLFQSIAAGLLHADAERLRQLKDALQALIFTPLQRK